MSIKDLLEGLYEQVITLELERRLEALDPQRLRIFREGLDEADSHEQLARHVAGELARALAALPEEGRLAQQLELCNAVLERIRARVPHAALPDVEVPAPGEILWAVHPPPAPHPRPLTPLATSTLLTGASSEPRLGTELAHRARQRGFGRYPGELHQVAWVAPASRSLSGLCPARPAPSGAHDHLHGRHRDRGARCDGRPPRRGSAHLL